MAPVQRSRRQDYGRSSRDEVVVKIALDSDRQTAWHGRMVGLDRFQVKVKLGAKRPSPSEGSNVWLQFRRLDSEFTMPVGGMVWRANPDGLITVLLSLSSHEFQRIHSLANTLSGEQQAKAPAVQGEYKRAAGNNAPRHVGASMTMEERERALLALIHEGRKMRPSREELAVKIAEMKRAGDKERSKGTKKTRRW